VRSAAEVEQAARLARLGLSDREVGEQLGIPLATVRKWRRGERRSRPRCLTCGGPVHDPDPPDARAYAYLLGLYLGDGHVACHRASPPRLAIGLDSRHPGIIAGCVAAMEATRPGRRAEVRAHADKNLVEVRMYATAWICLLPQHGPGRKHERPIVLADWQQRLVDQEAHAFLRGLIHSDGSRFVNRVRKRGREYRYVRYTFVNRSDDIRRLFTDTCDRLDIAWRPMTRFVVSVARRDAVAKLDAFVGPKA
jgi:hypothetical protein